MPGRLYALLVGINDYAPDVGKLTGCLNDVDHFRDYLQGNFDKAALAIEVLKDGDATRDNLIRQFRTHLGQARDSDVVVFQYCGHGARWASAAAFREFYPDGKDEGLVLFDSRRPGGFDLADKELAALIAEVAKNDPHIAVILDCCHSGSGTRGVDAFRGLRPRLTHEVAAERPLETYLAGHYAGLLQKKLPLFVPTGRHVLLAACERGQLAQEMADQSGVFTSTLIEVLSKSGGDLTYADLFVRCRAAVRTRAENQNPQFETFDRFNASLGFLGRNATHAARRYSVYFDQGWQVECGAIHGAPTDSQAPVAFALYSEADQARAAGTAIAVQIGPQKSALELGFASDQSIRYRAEITSMPVPPLLVLFIGDAKHRAALQQALHRDGAVNVTLTDLAPGVRYALAVDGDKLLFTQRDTDLLIQCAVVDPTKLELAAAALLPAVKQVAQWERSLVLANPRTRMDPSLVDFFFAERLTGGTEHIYPPGEIVLDYARAGGTWQEIRGKLKVRNRTTQTLHMALAYFSTAYGIRILKNDPIEPGGATVTMWGENPDDYFYLEDPANQSIESFKLIVSTEKLDGFLLEQEELELGAIATGSRAIGSVKPQKKLAHRNEWFTKDCRIKVVRRLDTVGATDAKLASGRIVVKAHPSIKANLSLAAAKTPTRGADGGSDFYRALEHHGLSMLNFAGTRGDNESILELTDIENAASLKDHPLEIELDVPLAANEGILPLVYDGQHVLLGGDAHRDAAGKSCISIDHLPVLAEQRRSLGGSLKLYFFKTYLKQDNVNLLRWVEFKSDGTCVHQKSMVADKVAAAKNILVLVHGITGDTEGMAAGVRACGLDRKFDLVLAYDYENLSTPIPQTAKQLKAQLAAAGLDQSDDKRLTFLVHSMGGLVSRWFIEREGGNKIVDHLVMCGTPNNGSPFGKIDGARKIFNVLAGLAINYVPVAIPFASAAVFLLNRSKKLTPTLEQMNPSSEFIHTLNQSDDPGIPYTILAGDIGAYREPADQFFEKMLAKTGQSFVFEALFARQANDIAVGVESILGVSDRHATAPMRKNVACHHLNYFNSEAGQQALGTVQW